MRPIPPVDFHTFFSSGIVSSGRRGILERIHTTLDYPSLDSVPRFFSLSLSLLFPFPFSEEREGGQGSLPPPAQSLRRALEFIPRLYGASERAARSSEPAIFLEGEQGARAGNDLWRSTGSEEKARDTWMHADGATKGGSESARLRSLQRTRGG